MFGAVFFKQENTWLVNEKDSCQKYWNSTGTGILGSSTEGIGGRVC